MRHHDKCPLHKDVIDFWSNNGKEINSRLLNSKGGDIIIYFMEVMMAVDIRH